MKKKKIVISAINFRSGGPLSVLNDCLEYLDNNLSEKFEIVALIHKKSVVLKTKNIEFIEFPNSINSYFYRIYYEYFHFYGLSKKLKPYLWLSLHDITPRVQSDIQAVYCHNPSPFYKIKLKYFIIDFKFTLFALFYRYLYRINIKANDFVIVQQGWLRKKFIEMYNVENCIVSWPNISLQMHDVVRSINKEDDATIFFYPSFPRIFKNFELVCEAAKMLHDRNVVNFKLILTIDGEENAYTKSIIKKYKDVDCINFIGLQTREQVFDIYSVTDCMIFASKLETWGMPITEFKTFQKPMLLSDLEYAHETAGVYELVRYFDPDDAGVLSGYMEDYIKGRLIYSKSAHITPAHPVMENWGELFNCLLSR